MELLAEHFGELIVGFVLSVFAWSFKSWSDTVKRIASEFRTFQLQIERRLVKLETQMHEIERLCNENRRRRDGNN